MHAKPSFNTPSPPLPASVQLVKCTHSTLLWGFITEESFQLIYFKPCIFKKSHVKNVFFCFYYRRQHYLLLCPDKRISSQTEMEAEHFPGNPPEQIEQKALGALVPCSKYILCHTISQQPKSRKSLNKEPFHLFSTAPDAKHPQHLRNTLGLVHNKV